MMVLLVLSNACSKYYDPPPVFENAADKPFTKKRKLLLIVIDGAAGPEIKKIAPPALMGLTEHAKYTWEAFGDTRSGDGPSWINILTGKSAALAAVSDSTLAPVADEEDEHEHEEIPVYSNFFQRLLVSGYLPTTVSITPWELLSERALKFSGRNIAAANDRAVKDSALRNITDDKVGVMLVNFNGVNLAGRAAAFSADEVLYKNAVLTVDGYVKELLEAVKKRPDYANEDWLTIVTSNHGGTGNSYGGPSFAERKVLSIYNNSNLKGQELELPSIRNTFVFTGSASAGTRRAVIPAAEAGPYEIGASGDMTIMAKVMMLTKPSGGANHVTLAYKANHAYSGVRGWTFQHAATGAYRYVIGDGALIYIGGSGTEASGPVGSWDVVALKIYAEGSKRFAVMYTNGKRGTPVEITGRNINGSAYDFGLGTISTSQTTANFVLQDVGIWNKALPDDYIENYGCLNGIPQADINNGNLIGYWPCDEGDGTVIKNGSSLAAGKDAVLGALPAWSIRSSLTCGDTGNTAMIVNSDIAPNLFYWLNLTPLTSWGFESKEWLSRYETEFIK
ncbi:DUF4983 domain-containing protein [Niabella beijingensis]|uniref:DUF4983 domain-containing protein n=1 Tax=Niabella beijingensis TaxID=2872700 RepID=UPI001CBFFB54|nr:DUF4983 domain-containing protein [Niabella beijingensis]MBZ4188300.1 DUF4983 domain-containing protein [Niabella beijingensis]